MSTDPRVGRIVAADARRRQAGLPAPDTDAYRLVHDQWDGLPGLIVDRLGDVAVARLRHEAWTDPASVDALLRGLAAVGLHAVHVLVDEPNKHSVRQADDVERALRARVDELGRAPTETRFPVRERGRTFLMSLDEGFSQGLFLDMREPRDDLAARWSGRRILNLFAYTCGFGVALAPNNDVVNVDVSARYLAWGRENYARNGLDAPRGFVECDAFEFLARSLRRGDRFDAVVLDPPVYSRGKKGRSREFSLRRDLGPLVEDALSLLAPGGELFVSTNYAALEPHAFRRLLVGIARDVRFRYWIARQWTPPPDFPATPDAWHLKTALLVPERNPPLRTT